MESIAVQQEQREESAAGSDDREGQIEATSRSLRNSIIYLALFFVLLIGLLVAVPGLRSAAEQITDANVGWVVSAIGLEVLSCLGYVVLFDLVFGKLAGALSSRLSLAELAANSVVSVSGLAGIALGAWVLRSRGVSATRIARRSVLIFVLTSAVNVVAVIVIGVLMWLGVLPGSRNELLTLLPAAIALATLVAVLVLAKWARGEAARGGLSKGRVRVALNAIGGGVGDAVTLLRRPDWRLLGAVGYWLFDALALYAALLAFGHSPSFWVVAMAYLLGMMANSIPVPAGLVAVEGGLVGFLVLFHARPVAMVVAAVVVYRAISLWVPALIGSAAFVSLRREIAKPLAPPAPG
jgi:uncharacterized membrane protein YbhN (UPF0104 family)